MKNYLRGNVDEELALTTLASKDVVGAAFDEVVDNPTFISSIQATYTLENLTETAGVGPVVCGVAHGSYTDAEIEEFLEQAGQWNRGNIVATREISRRLIRQVGTFESPAVSLQKETLNDGRAIKTKLGWWLQEGQTLRLWAYNAGSVNIATTVPSLTVNGHVNLFARGG